MTSDCVSKESRVGLVKDLELMREVRRVSIYLFIIIILATISLDN